MTRSRCAFRRLALGLGLLAVAAFTPCAALAQTGGKGGVSLARSCEAYERALEAIRRDARSQLDAKMQQAKRLKDNTIGVNAVQEELKDFESAGALPDVKARDKLTDDYARAAAAMRKAYNDAKAAYAGGDGGAELAAITAEAERFETRWDLVPWQDRLTRSNKAEAERTLAPGGPPLAVETGLKGEYRIDLKARRSGDAGTLSVEIPLANGKRLTLPAVAGERGNFRVLLTVMVELVGADLGVPRPIDLSKSHEGGGRGIVLRAEGGPVVVESVRVKTVVEGRPPEVREAKRPPKKDAPRPVEQENPFQPGRTWAGSWNGSGCEIRVLETGGNTVIQVSGAPGTYRLGGTVVNGVLNIDSITHVARGRGRRTFTSQSGTAWVRGNNLFIGCEARNNHGKKKAELFIIDIDGAAPK